MELVKELPEEENELPGAQRLPPPAQQSRRNLRVAAMAAVAATGSVGKFSTGNTRRAATRTPQELLGLGDETSEVTAEADTDEDQRGTVERWMSRMRVNKQVGGLCAATSFQALERDDARRMGMLALLRLRYGYERDSGDAHRPGAGVLSENAGIACSGCGAAAPALFGALAWAGGGTAEEGEREGTPSERRAGVA